MGGFKGLYDGGAKGAVSGLKSGALGGAEFGAKVGNLAGGGSEKLIGNGKGNAGFANKLNQFSQKAESFKEKNPEQYLAIQNGIRLGQNAFPEINWPELP